jgi:hypothetical protein
MNATLANLHDRDFHRWTQENARLIREGRLNELDYEHLLEELDSMGSSERGELKNRMRVLLAHLLKWRFQPQYRGRSWLATIEEQRLSIQDLLSENPSLRPLVEERIRKAYPLAVLTAVRETDLPKSTFPAECPYSAEQALNIEFLPD